MNTESEEIIKAHLDRALETQGSLICFLRNGLTETKYVSDMEAPLYTKIVFKPDFYYEGYYSGVMFYPNAKWQGAMDFTVKSFVSVVCLEEG